MPDYAAAERAMSAIYLRHYPLILNRGAADVGADLGQEITLDPKATARVMDQIGARVKGVIDTQRERIATLTNTYEGDSTALRAAIQEALDTTELRAAVIARSEVQAAYNQGIGLAADSLGERAGIRLADGDEDEICAAVNGKLASPAWLLANPTGHPNCTREGSVELIDADTPYDLE